MSEKRFYLGNNDTTICDRSQGGSDGFNMLTIFKVVDLLNEQQATIQELERKVKKYARIGEEQLEQIIDLQEELNECRARPTLATDERGVVKVEYR